MYNILRAALFGFVLSVLFIAYNLPPDTAQLRDFLWLMHTPTFWRLDFVVTGALLLFEIFGSICWSGKALLTSANCHLAEPFRRVPASATAVVKRN